MEASQLMYMLLYVRFSLMLHSRNFYILYRCFVLLRLFLPFSTKSRFSIVILLCFKFRTRDEYP